MRIPIVRRRPIFLFLLLAAASTTIQASEGDTSASYIDCVRDCTSQMCGDRPHALMTSQPLRLLRWTCSDDCRYTCQQQLTVLARTLAPPDITEIYARLKAEGKGNWGWYDQAKLPGLPMGKVVQFHGKWPFKRLWGMQEPASVIFSLANFVQHARWYPRLGRDLPRSFPATRTYVWLPVVSMNAWFWSSVFHARDWGWTEKMDYFSAASVILFSVYTAIIRLFRLWSPTADAGLRAEPTGMGSGHVLGLVRRTTLRTILKVAAASALVGHCSYLSLWKFDYAYNMGASVALGITHNLLWYGWSLAHFLARRRRSTPTATPDSTSSSSPHWWVPPIMCTILMLVMCLELFDFPPVALAIDAHALWHASTVPLIGVWYEFLVKDARWLVKADEGAQSRLDGGVGKVKREF